MADINWALARKQQTLIERARIITKIRAFFSANSYLEVETPQRIPANAPEVHIDQVASGDWVLHTSPEIAMKRLLAAGYEKIFQLCRVWRGDERGGRHLPEFTMLEWYQNGVDYNVLMEECEALLLDIEPSGVITYHGKRIKLDPPWERLTVAEAFDKYASQTLLHSLENNCFEEILNEEVEPNLGIDTPTFLTEYPAELAALARTKQNNPSVAERFELYINGMELANAFSELSDPVEQRRRFEVDERARRAAGKPARELPEPFLSELETMPDCAGIALGVDRLVMLITGAEKIDDVIALTPEML